MVENYIKGGDVAQSVRSSDRHAADAGSIPQMRQEIFLPESTFSADSLTRVRTHPCAILRISICAHVKDLVVHVRVRWIMETLKHPACTVGWVARVCRSWPFPEKATRISHGRNPTRTIQLSKVFKKYFFLKSLIQPFLQEATVNSSGMGRNIHSLTLSIQHFLCRLRHCPPSKVP